MADAEPGQGTERPSRLQRGWQQVRGLFASAGGTSAAAGEVAEQARTLAPVVWLIGKVQSGKTSIIRALTGADGAEIGDGFKACTRTAVVFDYPQEAPVIRFLDTRGLGEAGYDPAEDLAFAEAQAHLIVAVMRALDPQQEAVVAAVRAARRRHPDWPVLVAQTSLHNAYAAGQNHPAQYPFAAGPEAALAAGVGADLLRALAHQRSLFAGMPGRAPVAFVPIDFTLAADGYTPQFFGLDAFKAAIAAAAPAAVAGALDMLGSDADDAREARAHPQIVGYAMAAAAADLVPVAGLVAVPGVQAKLLHTLGGIYGVAWDRRTMTEFAGALGTSVLLRYASGFGLRQLTKLIPVYGQTAGAAAAATVSFGTTFALGKAACYFLRRRRAGVIDKPGVARVYAEELQRAFGLARERGLDGNGPAGAGAP